MNLQKVKTTQTSQMLDCNALLHSSLETSKKAQNCIKNA